MQNFFTPISNGTLSFAPPVILALLALLTAGTAAAVLWYKKHPDDKKLIRILALLQLAEFLSVNVWYWAAGYLAFPLPLFHCRIAKIVMIVLAFLPKKTRTGLRPLLAYALPMAYFGAISSFVHPDPDPFLWPHITHIGYFFGHFNLMIFATAFLMENEKPWSGKDLLKGQVLLIALNLTILPIARSTGINYSYLLESPIFNDPIQSFGPSAFAGIMLVVYALLFTVAFTVMKFVEFAAKGRAAQRRSA